MLYHLQSKQNFITQLKKECKTYNTSELHTFIAKWNSRTANKDYVAILKKELIRRLPNECKNYSTKYLSQMINHWLNVQGYETLINILKIELNTRS